MINLICWMNSSILINANELTEVFKRWHLLILACLIFRCANKLLVTTKMATWTYSPGILPIVDSIKLSSKKKISLRWFNGKSEKDLPGKWILSRRESLTNSPKKTPNKTHNVDSTVNKLANNLPHLRPRHNPHHGLRQCSAVVCFLCPSPCDRLLVCVFSLSETLTNVLFFRLANFELSECNRCSFRFEWLENWVENWFQNWST